MAWYLGSDAILWGDLWLVSGGYSYISGSLSCALGCLGTSRVKTAGFDLHARLCTLVICGMMPM